MIGNKTGTCSAANASVPIIRRSRLTIIRSLLKYDNFLGKLTAAHRRTVSCLFVPDSNLDLFAAFMSN